ncbi:MAG: ABC transporter permease [Gemmatimonadaceae bacterium]
MSRMHAIRERIVALTMSGWRDRDLEREIAHHLDLETARQIERGYPPDVARMKALGNFGDPRRVADQTRDQRGRQIMEGGMQDLRWAIRSLRKNLGFTLLALVTLTLGVGATTAAYSVLDTVLLRPLPYRDADRLVLIREKTDKHNLLAPSYPNFIDWRDRARAFDGVASAMFPYFGTVWPATNSPEPVRVSSMGVSKHFFATLGVAPVVGREFTDAENALGGPSVAMVSYEFWQSQMGGRQPLGTILRGDKPTVVVGVLPPGFHFVNAADIYWPHEQAPGTVRSGHNYLVIGKLKPTASLTVARSDMTALSRDLFATWGNDTQAVDADVTPLRDYLVSNFRVLLSVVLGAAVMVLLIACVNLLSAQLARGWAREREIAVRAALGASRGRLARQLCLESLVLVTVGSAMGLLLAFGLIATIKSVGTGLIPRINELSIDARVLGFVVAATLLTTVVVGVYPALRLSRGQNGVLLGGTRVAGSAVRASLWRALVGFEVALAVVLIIGSALFVQTLHNILTSDSGVDTHGIVTAAFAPDSGDLRDLDRLHDGLATIPGVTGVAFSTRLPFSWGSWSGPLRRRSDPLGHDWPAMAGFRVVTPGYFSVMRQHVIAGREFTANDRDGAIKIAIITKGAAEKLWPGENAVGKTIATNFLFTQWLTVVGVVAEATSWTMPRGEQNEIFVPVAQQPNSVNEQLIAVVRTSGDPRSILPAVRSRIRAVVPTAAADIGTLDERVARSAADRRFAMLALTAFGAIALLLAGVGIYGVVWYIVTTRTREIGIRMALGATAAGVQRQMLTSALAMALGGVIVGVAGAIFATRFVQSSLYGISRLDPWAYVMGASLAIVVALLGAFVPARRSSRVDPLIALRSDG